jgi:hypothetical protein
VIATILSKASALYAQVSEPEKERPENPEQPAAGAEGVPVQADRATGFPTGYWIEFDDTKDWLRLTSGEWLRGDLNWMRNGDFEFTARRAYWQPAGAPGLVKFMRHDSNAYNEAGSPVQLPLPGKCLKVQSHRLDTNRATRCCCAALRFTKPKVHSMLARG